jgi:hypothetical protein
MPSSERLDRPAEVVLFPEFQGEAVSSSVPPQQNDNAV